MNTALKSLLIAIILLTNVIAQSEQQFADIGNFKLVSGEIIYHCKIGYRTFGVLNADKSNAILFPTWFGGKSEHLANLIGPDNLVDSKEYFVIAVDALGNGISSSPSNCEYQKNGNFPHITIKDMVNSQYKLLTEHLGINHLYGIIGGSMGGMQVFEWVVSYPNFMEKAIPYVGSPKLTSFDLLLWQAELNAIEAGWKGEQPDSEIVKTVTTIHNMMARTPQYVIQNTKPESVSQMLLEKYKTSAKTFNSYNWAAQLQAMKCHDIFKDSDGLNRNAAATVKTKLFIIVGAKDLMVNPNPAIEFAELVDAETYIFENDCGHLAPGCEMEPFKEMVQDFFDD